jgi:hypothetical protein
MIPQKLYKFLEIAYQSQNHQNHTVFIREALSAANLFPPNVRTDSKKEEVWRDYQQALAEIGLIYSTRYTDKPHLTPLGLMYIDGSIGHSELFSIQSLAYQYPNGHKTVISRPVTKALQQANMNIPASRVDLDVNAGVLIKPGVLILQILAELYRQGHSPSLTTRECVLVLMPTKRHADWEATYASLMQLRQRGNLPEVEDREHRHIQEWFNFLGYSDFVTLKRGTMKRGTIISLSPIALALEAGNQLQSILDFHSDPVNFWLPQGFSPENTVSWYGYFGNPSLEGQWFTPEYLRNQDYLEQNYLIEPEPLDDLENVPTTGAASGINLRPFAPRIPETEDVTTTIDAEAIIQGRRLSRDRTRQHQEVLARLAQRLTELSYDLSDDPNSVDLLAVKNGVETIFEVKTITRRNAWYRIRLGVGQLSEYRYRRRLQTQSRPNSILVLSNTLQIPEWAPGYFSDDVEIGLICSTSNLFIALTNGAIELEVQNVS